MKHRIVVLGAGYAGTYVAGNLARRLSPDLLPATPTKRRFAGGTPAVHYAPVNGAPAVLFVLGDQVVGTVTFDVVLDKIATVRGIAAPARLARLAEAWRRHEPDPPLIARW